LSQTFDHTTRGRAQRRARTTKATALRWPDLPQPVPISVSISKVLFQEDKHANPATNYRP
jgi:hypothetical protein